MCTGTRLSCAGAPCPHFFPGGRGTQPPGLVTTTLVPSIHSGCTGSPLHRPNTCQERGDRDVCNFSVCDLSSARQPAPQVRGWGTPSESQPWTADVTVLARVRQQGASENPDDLGGPQQVRGKPRTGDASCRRNRLKSLGRPARPLLVPSSSPSSPEGNGRG